MISYKTDLTGVDWTAAAEIFTRAPLGTRKPDMLHRAFQNSYAYVFAYDDETLVGLARAICDGEYQAAVYDVVLLPEYQKRGIGKQMMNELLKQISVKNVILYAVPGREGFYAKCGFRKMRTAMAVLHSGVSNPEHGYLEAE
jgi:GNAT superfamily N-acetyltransferase